MKLWKLTLCLMLILSMAAGLAVAETLEPLTLPPFEETVTITQGRSDVTDRLLPNGDTVSDNDFTRYLLEKYNIQLVNEWVAADSNTLEQKISLALASGEMPDILTVDYNTLLELYENDMLADLTDLYDTYMSPALKYSFSTFETADGFNPVLDMATFDGRLMAIPNTGLPYQQNMLWLRSDWMENLGLEMPTTMDELKDVLRAFINDDPDGNGVDDTVGLPMVSTVGGIYGQVNDVSLIFGLYNAFPRSWIRNDEGNIVYGSVEPEMKDALAELHSMYAEGLIDVDFAVREDPNELTASGKAGACFGPWWIPQWPLNNSVANDPTADWRPVVAPLNENGEARLASIEPANQFVVVSKECEHPEAVLMTLGFGIDCWQGIDPEYLDHISYFNDDGTIDISWTFQPIAVQICNADIVPLRGEAIHKAAETGVTEGMLTEDYGYFQGYLANLENPGADSSNWGFAIAGYYGIEQSSNPAYVYEYPVFFGTTETMQQRWSSLEKMEDEIYLKIIMGEAELDAFDAFVDQWYKLGGEMITEEVRAIIDGE